MRSLLAMLSLAASFTAMTASAMAEPPEHAAIPVAARLGFTPAALVVANLSTSDATALLERVHAEAELREALAVQMQMAHDSAQQVAAAVLALHATPEDIATSQAHETAVAALTAAQAEVAAIEEQLFNAAISDCATSQQHILLAWRSSAGLRAPAEFRVVERSDGEWEEIIEALRAESRALRLGNPLVPEFAQVLAEVRAAPLVETAHLQLQTSLALMESHIEAISSQFIDPE